MSLRQTEQFTVRQYLSAKLADYKQLVKFRLNLLVVFSAAMSYAIAAPASAFDLKALLVLCMGGFFVTGASNALNQVLEKDYDRLMLRTLGRPLPQGNMSVAEAVLAAGIMSLFGITLLALFNPIASLLGAVSLMLYAFVYTPMKRVSPASVWIGAIPGALPLMIGCVAVEGHVSPLAWALFALQFFWQFPHFWAVAWLADEDYKRAGFRMLPSVTGEKDRSTGLQAFVYALMLVPVGALPYWLGISGIFSVFALSVLALAFAYPAWQLYKRCDRESARRLMFASFFYLPLSLMAILLDKL